MTILALVLAAFAVMRVTRLVTTDEVAQPLRLALVRRFPPSTKPLIQPQTGDEVEGAAVFAPHWVVVLLSCGWCLSFWLALVAVIALHFAGWLNSWALVALAWLAVAGAAGILFDYST